MKGQLKRPKTFLGVLVALALTLSIAMGVSVMAESPPGANNNNVQMSLAGLPTGQKAGQSVDFYMVVSNPSSTLPDISANAEDITITFYPAQADGTPSASGTIVGTIPSLAVDAAPVTIGPVTYPMPYLNPGVTQAVYRAVLDGTILLGSDPAGLSFSIVKEVPITSIQWMIDKTVTDVDGGGPTGSVDEAGDTISYQVVISNTGDVLLQGNLTDSLPGIYGMSGPAESGGTIADWLEPGENWTYTYKYDAKQSDIDANGINKNGVADGDGDIDNEATFTDNYANSESDIEDVPILQNINWTIDKTVTDVDGHGPTGSVDEAGDTISYQVVISNTGDVSLQGSLVDSLPGIYDMSGPVESGGTIADWLEPGETWTYTYKYDAKQSDIDANGINKNGVADGDGDIDNEATFTDNYANSESDSEDVPIREGRIHIEKHTNGVDADTAPGPYISINSTVTWTYTVTNIGTANLTGIAVTDNMPGVSPVLMSGDDGSDGVLEPHSQTGETWIYQATGVAVAGQYANNGTVVGYYGLVEVTDSDPSHYYNRPAVGWETYPVNKARVLLPWIGLLGAIIAGASLLVLRRRRPIQKS